MSVQRRKYDPDFKRDAVRLTEEPGRTVIEVAENLGISKALLYKWQRELRPKEGLAFPGHESLTEQEKRIKELEKKLKDAEMERDILKKAMAIFRSFGTGVVEKEEISLTGTPLNCGKIKLQLLP